MTVDDEALAILADATAGMPTRVRFGRGIGHEVGSVAAAHGSRTVVVTGASFRSRPDAVRLLDALADAGVTVTDEIVAVGEPDDVAVRALVGRLATAAPDSIMAIGGGSPIDLAKAAAQRPTPDRLAALLAGERAEEPGLPVIAVPTTAGTGAETSFAAIILDRSAGRKRGIRGRGVAPTDAIVDPDLMGGVTPDIAATAGFDAIAHAVETASSRVADAAVIERSGFALPRLLAAIPMVVRRPGEPDGWDDAALAATLMGVNLARSSTCLPHRLQYPVGARTGTAHGAGVAALFPAWLERTVATAPGPLARLARSAGMRPDDSDDLTAARALADAVVAHLEATGMRRTLGDLGIQSGDVDGLVDAVEGSVANDPGPTTRDDLRALYAASL